MSSSFFFRRINSECGREYDALESIYECPACHDLLDLAYSFPDFDAQELKALLSKLAIREVGSTS